MAYEYDVMKRVNDYLHSEFPTRQGAEHAAMYCRTMTSTTDRYDIVAVPRDGYINYRVYLVSNASISEQEAS